MRRVFFFISGVLAFLNIWKQLRHFYTNTTTPTMKLNFVLLQSLENCPKVKNIKPTQIHRRHSAVSEFVFFVSLSLNFWRKKKVLLHQIKNMSHFANSRWRKFLTWQIRNIKLQIPYCIASHAAFCWSGQTYFLQLPYTLNSLIAFSFETTQLFFFLIFFITSSEGWLNRYESLTDRLFLITRARWNLIK